MTDASIRTLAIVVAVGAIAGVTFLAIGSFGRAASTANATTAIAHDHGDLVADGARGASPTGRGRGL